jgi:alpha-glucosidase
MSYVSERKPDPLHLHVYPGDGSFALYEDDGETLDYTKGVYALTSFQVSERTGELTLRKSPREGSYEPGREFVLVVLHGAGDAVKALKDGSELKPLASPEEGREGLTRVEGKPAVKVREVKGGWELKVLAK